MAYVNTVNEQVRELDPGYDPPRHSSSFYPQSLLESGIRSYIMWVQKTRIGQVVRSMSVFLLAALVIFLAIRHNTNERRFERNMLISRGASPSDLDGAVNREVFILSLVSCIAGIPLGALFSRIAMASSGFFRISLSNVITEPFLISIESIIISAVVGVALPMVTLAGYRSIYSTKKRVEDHPGKLSKLVRGLTFIRWDVLVVGISSLLLLLIYSGGTATASLLMFLQPVPLALFLGVSSLAIKALRGGSRIFSRVLKRPLGAVPTSVGVRRVGKSASSAGAAMMVLVLAICLSWSSAIVDLSLPATKTNQARLDIGADIAFSLDSEESRLWADFTDNVTSIDGVHSVDMTAEVLLSLTADESGFSTFLAVSPDDYSTIGFDYRGQRLNESGCRDLLVELESTLDGAIITSDLAQIYDLSVGESLRASNLDSYDPQTHEFRVLGIVTALPKMPEVEYPWWAQPYDEYYYRPILAGQRRIMINREYLSTLLNITESAQSYLCVRTEKDANGTAIAEEVLGRGGENVLFNGVWNAVDKSVSELVHDAAYSMERAIDTMLTVLTVGTILAAFALYAAEGVRTRKREIALLRSMGAEKRLIVSAQAAEMFVLILFGLVLLTGYAPLFLGSSVIVSVTMTLASNQIYPVSAFVVVPWPTIALVLLFFIVLSLVFIVVVALVSSRIHLASALNATWAEAGPYGGDV
ncbi:ABC transporter permease [Candidatus Thorarchaeota archaeon]|nr:MAG: ABC transporter permease [Candidatus Thorarchaeota archaeon]